MKLWYQRYGNLNMKSLMMLKKIAMVSGPPELQDLEESCEACLKDKQTRSKFLIKDSTSSRG